jgi:hypothetical protein
MAFNETDIQEAFECARARDRNVESEPWKHTTTDEEKVFEHLRGSCPCDLRRCAHCRKRSTNNMPKHEPTCPMEMKR